MPTSRTEPAKPAAADTTAPAAENRVPETAENFEHSLRRIVIEKAEARRTSG